MSKSKEVELIQLFHALCKVHEEGNYPVCVELAESMKAVSRSKGLHKQLNRIIQAEGRYNPVLLWGN